MKIEKEIIAMKCKNYIICLIFIYPLNIRLFVGKLDKFCESIKLQNSTESLSNKTIIKKKILIALCLQYRLEIEKTNNKSIVDYYKSLISERFLFSIDDKEFVEYLESFIGNKNVEYCHIYSVVSSVLCQEIFKIITDSEEPQLQIYTYDSLVNSGFFIKNIDFVSKK